MATGVPCHKVILVGEFGVGKSSLFRRFVDNGFEPDPVKLSKAGLDNFSKTFTFDSQTLQVTKASLPITQFFYNIIVIWQPSASQSADHAIY